MKNRDGGIPMLQGHEYLVRLGGRTDYSGKYVEVGFIKGFVVTGPSFRSLHIDIEAGVG